MRFMRKSREVQLESGGDPMGGVANLFDTAVVFIAALLLALLTYYDARVFSKDAEVTIVKKDARNEMTVIRKKGRRIKAVRVTPEQAAGRGTRLGTAYRLEDGSVIYVPEE